jgi:UDP-N-acetyl-D-mannosaminuronate dehydrogenase
MMTEIRQVCSHYMSGNCKYGSTCNKIHMSPTIELLQAIEKKGTSVCNYHPNCKFTADECKKLHIDYENANEKDLNELKRLYLGIVNMNVDYIDQPQIERVKNMIKYDIEFLKDTYECLLSKKK